MITKTRINKIEEKLNRLTKKERDFPINTLLKIHRLIYLGKIIEDENDKVNHNEWALYSRREIGVAKKSGKDLISTKKKLEEEKSLIKSLDGFKNE